MENNNLAENESDLTLTNKINSEEHTPKLFTEEKGFQTDEEIEDTNDRENFDNEQLFDQDIREEDEDFEIPAFLRKQKF